MITNSQLATFVFPSIQMKISGLFLLWFPWNETPAERHIARVHCFIFTNGGQKLWFKRLIMTEWRICNNKEKKMWFVFKHSLRGQSMNATLEWIISRPVEPQVSWITVCASCCLEWGQQGAGWAESTGSWGGVSDRWLRGRAVVFHASFIFICATEEAPSVFYLLDQMEIRWTQRKESSSRIAIVRRNPATVTVTYAKTHPHTHTHTHNKKKHPDSDFNAARVFSPPT